MGWKNVQKENDGQMGEFVIDRQWNGEKRVDCLLKIHKESGNFGRNEGVCRSSFMNVARHLKNRTGMRLYI